MFFFFLVVYLYMALNSHGKLYSIISTNEESYLIDIAKYAAMKISLKKCLWMCHNENFWTTYFIHKFYNTNKFFTWNWFY